jgi:hypothetical protein
MGHDGTNWELGFKQCSFHHIIQVLRGWSFSAFSLPPAFPPCSCSLAFQRQVRWLTYRTFSESYPGIQVYVVSYRGAHGSCSVQGQRVASYRRSLLRLAWAVRGYRSGHYVTGWEGWSTT